MGRQSADPLATWKPFIAGKVQRTQGKVKCIQGNERADRAQIHLLLGSRLLQAKYSALKVMNG